MEALKVSFDEHYPFQQFFIDPDQLIQAMKFGREKAKGCYVKILGNSAGRIFPARYFVRTKPSLRLRRIKRWSPKRLLFRRADKKTTSWKGV